MTPIVDDQRPGIYLIRNRYNGKEYVGSAVCLRKRTAAHQRALVGGYHVNPHLQHAWDKHGSGAFAFDLLEVVEDKHRLLEREQEWIDVLGVVEHGYNISPTAGSLLGAKFSDGTKRKMSLAQKGKPATPAKLAAALSTGLKLKGRVVPTDQRAKMSVAKLGKKRGPHPLAHRAAISAAHKGRKKSPEHCAALARAKTGTKLSEETKRRMSLAQIARCKRVSLAATTGSSVLPTVKAAGEKQ